MRYPEQLETERLRLHWPRESDADEMFVRYTCDPVVAKFMLWRPHASVEDTRTFLKSRHAKDEQGLHHNWLIRLRSSDLLLGAIGCHQDRHIIQFGYCLAQDAWANGYATEAVSALVPVWLSVPEIWRVQAYCDLENPASARVLEKAGLVREGILRRYIVTPNLSDEPRDVYVYACVRCGESG